jgi:hypothetical protein
MSGATDESIEGGQPCGTWTRKYWRTDFNVAEAIEGPHVPCSSPRLSRVNCGALMGFSFSLLRFLRLPHFCGRRIRLDDLLCFVAVCGHPFLAVNSWDRALHHLLSERSRHRCQVPDTIIVFPGHVHRACGLDLGCYGAGGAPVGEGGAPVGERSVGANHLEAKTRNSAHCSSRHLGFTTFSIQT